MDQQEMTVSEARRLLRPTAAELETAWRALVREERLQVERLPNRPSPSDFYAPVAEHFRGGDEAAEDPVLAELRGLLRPDDTLLDLGAGGGRYALPLARHVARVIAVEPSQGMRSVLRDAVSRHNLTNIEVLDERWPGPSRAPLADAGIIVHVGYDIEEFGGFLDQFQAHCRRLCIAVWFERAPISYFAPLWPRIHAEQRVALPAAPELLRLLLARGSYAAVRLLQLPVRAFADVAALHAAARRPLWTLPGTPEDERLARAVEELALPCEGGVTLDPHPRRLAVISWTPS